MCSADLDCLFVCLVGRLLQFHMLMGGIYQIAWMQTVEFFPCFYIVSRIMIQIAL